MRTSLALMTLLAATSFASAADTKSETQTVHAFTARTEKSVTYRYLQFTPAGYEPAGEKRWPLLLFLHGAGERGSDPWLVAKHGPAKLLRGENLKDEEKAAAKLLAENFIVLSPQCPSGQIWDEDALLGLLDEAAKNLKIDPTRVYVSGLSMGGYGTWGLLGKAPDRFAAVAPICGGGRLIEFLVASGPRKQAFATMGVWAFHGAKDPTVPLEESEKMIGACKRAGIKDLELTVYPEAKHDSWTEAYANEALYTWLLKHVRTPATSIKP